jgi:uncharacterized protein
MEPSNPRLEQFGYVCRRCNRCCYHKDIQVNPYELARLARQLSLSTTKFRTTYTRNGLGTLLNQTETGACVFLGPEGCTVHPDRPLVCRLYPLGRHVLQDGTERFSHIDAHPESAGEYTNSGTISEFLESQNTAAYLAAADEYFCWLSAAYERFDIDAAAEGTTTQTDDGDQLNDLFDMDVAIASHCTKTGMVEPTDIEHRKQLHLTILYQQLNAENGRET